MPNNVQQLVTNISCFNIWTAYSVLSQMQLTAGNSPLQMHCYYWKHSIWFRWGWSRTRDAHSLAVNSQESYLYYSHMGFTGHHTDFVLRSWQGKGHLTFHLHCIRDLHSHRQLSRFISRKARGVLCRSENSFCLFAVWCLGVLQYGGLQL